MSEQTGCPSERRGVKRFGAGRTMLGRGGWLDYYPDWLPQPEAHRYFVRLREQLRWEQREIVLFGRRVLQPRLIAWAGHADYAYSGQVLQRRPIPVLLEQLFERVRATTGVCFNHVLLNRYRDQRDSMGLHADNEPELGPDPQLASLSLGAVRRFVVVPRRPGLERWECALAEGSLLVMGGTMQRHYRHGLPRSAKSLGERLNLTFRRVSTEP